MDADIEIEREREGEGEGERERGGNNVTYDSVQKVIMQTGGFTDILIDRSIG